MRLLLLFALLPTITAAAGFPGSNIGLSDAMLKFTYQPHDAPGTGCRHRVENAAAQDWEVICGDRKYTVHLWLTGYEHAAPPLLSYELLYWIVDRSAPQPVPQSTTVWFHLRDKSPLTGVDVGLGVDGDSASLRLEIRPPVLTTTPSEKRK